MFDWFWNIISLMDWNETDEDELFEIARQLRENEKSKKS